ncbi:MAG: SHOCT domain-containing protein [Pirellulaceae bacterium]|nr:SHOCT domain-containing protein [Pirellulaceae bacterium]
MNLSAELQKLAELHRDGQLTDREFATAKTRLLGPETESPERAVLDAPPPGSEIAKQVYRSSRWSSGNLFFPDQLTLAGDGLHFRKGALIGSHEEHIAYRAIASLKVENGIFLADLTIETSGGSQPIHINGLWKSSARKVQAAVQAAQSTGQR